MNDDKHYEQLRRDYERQLDDDYRSWQSHRTGSNPARNPPGGPAAKQKKPESAVESFGRAIGSVVTVPASPEGAAGLGDDPSAVGGVHSRQTS
ncbi:MAG: hypothetical protein H0W40_03120 [Methylibium sp.]|uniref:hypothetical protein n=1 Tax=Methylibium sp. TaxID=2067992 RepID=UPI001819A761|nr:hypothetical protein [Methylibium sp.]MBA3596354.1 hypothetical protein [Methylibium sp.]